MLQIKLSKTESQPFVYAVNSLFGFSFYKVAVVL